MQHIGTYQVRIRETLFIIEPTANLHSISLLHQNRLYLPFDIQWPGAEL
jgi:hypothetical protein